MIIRLLYLVCRLLYLVSGLLYLVSRLLYSVSGLHLVSGLNCVVAGYYRCLLECGGLLRLSLEGCRLQGVRLQGGVHQGVIVTVAALLAGVDRATADHRRDSENNLQ